MRRGRKAERRWIAQALKQWGCQSRKEKGQALLLQAVHMLLWLLSGIGAIGLSGALLLSTGIEQRERTEGPSLLLEGGAAPDWEREFFGVRIQLQNGQITFFRQKQADLLARPFFLYRRGRSREDPAGRKDKETAMEKKELLYEGKAKKVYTTEDPDVLIVSYKDDATAFNGQKKGTIVGKGAINNRMTNYIFKKLEEKGVPTHLVEELNDRETAVKRVEILPLEVIVRNFSAGSFAKKMGMEEGIKFKCPTLEFSYKNDDLGDPFINKYYALALELATEEEIEAVTKYAFQVNEVMQAYFASLNIELIDFKIEFGRYHGQVILADEVSPDTCRLWDKDTHEKLDKDRFRRDLGNVEDAYQEVFRRLGIE